MTFCLVAHLVLYHRESISTETAASSPGLGDTALPEAATISSARRYPNPGYLGISSHSTLFNQVSSGGESDPSSLPPASTRSRPGSPIHLLDNQVVTDRAIHALTRLDRIDISKITPLVHLWLDKGTNLPLAEPFVAGCLESVKQWRQLLTSDPMIEAGDFGPESMGSIYVKALLANTRKPIVMHRGMSPQEFLAQILEKNLRWESLGIFFIAAARAAYDISSFTPLYSTHEQRHRLIKTLTYIGDCCLETCIELDCLNDLQLVLQYENFIVHSQVDGDQSEYCLSYLHIPRLKSLRLSLYSQAIIPGEGSEMLPAPYLPWATTKELRVPTSRPLSSSYERLASLVYMLPTKVWLSSLVVHHE